MLRRPFLAITIAVGAAAVGATPVHAVDFGPANETASCVGEFASAGGTQLGSTFGAIISGGARTIPSFGSTIVRVQAHSDQPNCNPPIDSVLPVIPRT